MRRCGKNYAFAVQAAAGSVAGFKVITTKMIYDILKSMKDVPINWDNIPEPSDKISGKKLEGVVYDECETITERLFNEQT